MRKRSKRHAQALAQVEKGKRYALPEAISLLQSFPAPKFDETFEVANYEDVYFGEATLATATTRSDNSVYAELGTDLGADMVADTANELGIASNLGNNCR